MFLYIITEKLSNTNALSFMFLYIIFLPLQKIIYHVYQSNIFYIRGQKFKSFFFADFILLYFLILSSEL